MRHISSWPLAAVSFVFAVLALGAGPSLAQECSESCGGTVSCEQGCNICDPPVPIGMSCPDPILTTCGAYGANCVVWDPDGDGVGGLQDNCRDTYNPGQEDCDGDGTGDACDPDSSRWDRVSDEYKAFIITPYFDGDRIEACSAARDRKETWRERCSGAERIDCTRENAFFDNYAQICQDLWDNGMFSGLCQQ